MADVSTITLDNTVYNIKDVTAREEMSGMKKIFVGNQTPSGSKEGDLWFCFNEDSEDEWIRPAGWPDLDALLEVDEAENVFYYTVDNTGGDAWFATGMQTTPTNATRTLECGHIENGIFVADDSKTGTSQAQIIFHRSENTNWGNYPIFRFTTNASSLQYMNGTANVVIDGISTNTQRAKVIEGVCKFTGTVGLGNVFKFFTIERVRIDGGKISSLNFQDAIKLKKINAEDWDTSEITSMANFFNGCRYLTEIKCENWNVKKVTAFNSIFRDCKTIKKLDLSKWENDIATNFSEFLRGTVSLKTINFGKNFHTTTNTTSMYSMFLDCKSLIKIDLSYFNTSNVTDMQNLFSSCFCLQDIIGANNLDTSKITQGGKMPSFQSCFKLKAIPKGFQLNCESLETEKELNLSYMFDANFVDVDLSNIKHTEKITGPFLFNNNVFMETLDYHGWDTSNIKNFHSFWCSPNVKYLNLDGWDLTSLSSIGYLWNKNSIKEYYPPKIAISHSYNSMYSLDHASKLRILNILPEIETAQTLTLGAVRAGLTAEEIAIATEKGWTVA